MLRLPFLYLIMVALSISFVNCGSGGTDGSTPSVSSSNSQLSRIEGTVLEMQASALSGTEDSILLSRLHNSFRIIRQAFAQEEGLCGITVLALQNGEIVADAVTSCDGTFVLEGVPPGETTIMFKTELIEESIILDIPENSKVELKVSLNPESESKVTLNELRIQRGPISCAEGIVELGEQGMNNLLIQGEGGICINTEGYCELVLNAQEVELQECSTCVKSNGNSVVTINAETVVSCDSDSHGIVTSGNSVVDINSSRCVIESLDTPVLVMDLGNVDTEGCSEFVMVQTGTEENEGMNEQPNPVCEFDCSGNQCHLFCNDSVPGDCVEICSGVDNFSQCVSECGGFTCGEPACDVVCTEESGECVRYEEECVREEGQCVRFEEMCDEFCLRDEEVCVEDGCLRFEEVCEGEGENRECDEVCVEEGCIRFESECVEFGVECDEICVEDESVCVEFQEVCVEEQSECTEEGIECRFECE